MTIADPKFFRPWRKRMGYTHAQAARALNMSEADYRDLERSGQLPIIRAFARGWGTAVILILAFWHTQTAIAILGGVTIALGVWAARELT